MLAWSAWSATADQFAGVKDGVGQKKVLSAAFLPPGPPRATRRIGSGSDLATSKKWVF
jgi:hypothetical protein